MKVKIVGAQMDTYWYADRIGETFEVGVTTDIVDGILKYRIGNRYIDAEDVLVVREPKQRTNDELLETLLRKAIDLFDGTHELCYDVMSEEWIWKYQTLYALDDLNK